MPLPPSGQISISQIRTELGTSDGSLRYLSSLAGFSTPDAMSEFYGYSATRPVGLYNYSYYGYIQLNVNGSWYSPVFGYSNIVTYNIPIGSSIYAAAGDTLYGSIIDLNINGVYIGSWTGNYVETSTYTVAAGNTYSFFHNDLY